MKKLLNMTKKTKDKTKKIKRQDLLNNLKFGDLFGINWGKNGECS